MFIKLYFHYSVCDMLASKDQMLDTVITSMLAQVYSQYPCSNKDVFT